MARSNRRRTEWLGATINDVAITDNAMSMIELQTAAQLSEIMQTEPTLIRLVGRLCIGSEPADVTSASVVNCWLGIRLGAIGDTSISPITNIANESWVWSGFVRSVYILEPQVFGIVGAFASTNLTKNQQGPWEMVDLDGRAMRKARDGDSLILHAHTQSPVGTPDVIALSGAVRSLWKV